MKQSVCLLLVLVSFNLSSQDIDRGRFSIGSLWSLAFPAGNSGVINLGDTASHQYFGGPMVEVSLMPSYNISDHLGFGVGFGLGSQQFDLKAGKTPGINENFLFTDFVCVPSEIYYQWDLKKRFNERLKITAGTDIQWIFRKGMNDQNIESRTYFKSGLSFVKMFSGLSLETSIQYLQQLKSTQFDSLTNHSVLLDQNLVKITLRFNFINSGWRSA